MILLIHFLQARVGDVRVNLRGGDVGVAEERLHAAEVGTVNKEVSSETMTKSVGCDFDR